MGKKLTTEQFIARVKQKHGNRYNYSSTVYTGADDKVTIECPTHGKFFQRAIDHTSGRGCALCNERQPLTKELFAHRANERHNNKYLYDRVVYKNVTTKVRIICPEHGVFKQTPTDHLHGGYGCPVCGGTRKRTTKEFIKQAKQVHGTYYDYSCTALCGMNSKVRIICKEHGDFFQRAADHINGVGCSVCGIRKQGGYTEEYFRNHPQECELSAQLYLIQVKDQFCKLGITKKKYVKQRFPGLNFQVVTSTQMTLYEAYQHEQTLLQKYKKQRYKTKTLTEIGYTGWTECFPLSLLSTLKTEIEKAN